jgi:hypothetical protein
VGSAVQIGLRSPSQGEDLRSHLEPLGRGPADEPHPHGAPPPTLAAEAAPALSQVLLEVRGVPRPRGALGGARGGSGRDDLEDFWGAFDRVAASLTRGRPGARGTLSTTRCAGLTNPSSIARAAWSARRSSLNGASTRRRHWASTAGRTTCAWEPSTWTSLIPHAYLTARSGRNRLQICASEQASSWLRSANAQTTRVETGGRPRVVGVEKRWAHERSTAATRAAPGNVSAHGRSGGVAGTKSATGRHGPRPVSQGWR